MLARFHNNRAAEHLSRGQNPLAYAHFKVAILAGPAYAAPYGNLAQLYLRAGFSGDAGRLLRHAVALGGQSDLALEAPLPR